MVTDAPLANPCAADVVTSPLSLLFLCEMLVTGMTTVPVMVMVPVASPACALGIVYATVKLSIFVSVNVPLKTLCVAPATVTESPVLNA